MQIQLANALVSMRRLSQYFLLEDRKDDVGQLEDAGIEIHDGEFFWAKPPPKIVMPEVGKKKKKKTDAKDAKSSPDQEEATKTAESPESGKVTPSSASDQDSPKKQSKPDSVGDQDDNVAWLLKNVNLSVKKGELVCVVGRVGSGKSSLVQAIIGEMEQKSGTVAVGGNIGYAAQQPWIINASLQDNITFGKKFDLLRWEEAIDACCLKQDLEILPGGSETEIGEKGINLSGGQKQRVSLARALYQDADVYILDDPLSAVDVHVGKHIFENFINGAIKDKARLLVTNQLSYLPFADKIVMIDKGEIIVQGSLDDCNQNESFVKLLSEHNAKAGEEEEKEKKTETKAPKALQASLTSKAIKASLASAPAVQDRLQSVASGIERSATFSKLPEKIEKRSPNDKSENGFARLETMKKQFELPQGKKEEDKKGKLMMKEDQEVGQVTGKVYWNYIKAYGILSFIALVMLWSSEQTVRILTNWYLSQWTEAEMKQEACTQYLACCSEGESCPQESYNCEQSDLKSYCSDYSFNRYDYVGGYLGFAFGFVLLTSIRSFSNLMAALHASRVIHLKTLASLVRAPVTFFDTTPVGRILNRFSKASSEL